jgi:hypothetical protein
MSTTAVRPQVQSTKKPRPPPSHISHTVSRAALVAPRMTIADHLQAGNTMVVLSLSSMIGQDSMPQLRNRGMDRNTGKPRKAVVPRSTHSSSLSTRSPRSPSSSTHRVKGGHRWVAGPRTNLFGHSIPPLFEEHPTL